MFPYARLTPGPGFKPERALFYYSQRLVTLPPARDTVSALIAASVRLRQGGGGSAGLGAEGLRALGDLRRHGLAPMEPLAPQAQIDRMADYFLAREVLGPDGRLGPLADLPPGVAAAAYPLETVLDCPGLLGLLNAPEVLGIAGAYLGCKPTVSSVGVRWSLPRGDAPTRTQQYHRDLDDWRFLKLFIYLTDVDETSGPHAYVKGSHRAAFAPTAKAYSEAELGARYGAGAVTRVLGPRGTTFMADTLGIHCGLSPTARPRLILQIQYSLLPIYAFLYAPAARSEPELDSYCNRLLFHAAERPPA